MTTDYGHLRKTQLQQLHARIRAVGMSPEAFGWSPKAWSVPGGDSTAYPALFVRDAPEMNFTFAYSSGDTELAFLYDELKTNNSGRHSCWYQPGAEDPEERMYLASWSEVEFEFGTWLSAVAAELTAINPWEVEADTRTALTKLPEHGDDRFQPTEVEVVRRELEAIRLAVTTGMARQEARTDELISLTSEQRDAFDQFTAEAEDASKRLTKKDWQIYVVGLLTSFFVQTSITPDTGRHILTLLGHAFTTIFGGGHPQLP